MIRFILKRLGASLLLIWIVLTATFFLLRAVPGDPLWVFEGPMTTDEQRQHLRVIYGFDKPVWVQYGLWLGKVVQGDWGTSITLQRSVTSILADRFPNTVVLVLAVVIFEYGMGLPLGVVAAARAGTRVDGGIRVVSLLFSSVPVFAFGLVLIEVLAVRWGWFPIGQMSSVDAAGLAAPLRFFDISHHVVLPAAAIGFSRAATVGRYVRNGLLEILNQDYIRTARSVGLSPSRILWVHALKNSLGPLIQRFGFTLPNLLSGAVVAEVVFAWPGVGRMTVVALAEQDYPVVLAMTGLSATLVVLGSLMADLLLGMIDPRVRDHAR